MTDQAPHSGADNAWAPYAPDERTPWNLRRVIHLHRRAGFAATWSEIQRDLKDSPKACIDRFLAGNAVKEGVAERFAETADLLADRVGGAVHNGERLKAWWIYRMLLGPDPLTERLTLMWHNHFATGIAKIRHLRMMRRQNDIFRELARAPFGKLLQTVVRDPALLIWLDAPENRKGHANENLGRELMELFTLGIGHYAEKDVKEAARALTGWTVEDDHFKENGDLHDDGQKTVLGRTGKWKGNDLLKMLLDHPATAKRLAFRLCEHFMGENAVPAAALESLASGLRAHELDIGWGVETVLRSRAFFADANLGTRVLGPVEYAVGSARALAMFDPPPSTLLLSEWTARLGQDLFDPPNVGGWRGGRNWISTQSMIGRANFVAALVSGDLFRGRESLDALAQPSHNGRGDSLEDIVNFYAELLLGGRVSPAWCERILTSLGTKATASPETARRGVILILASPEAQLG